MSIPGFSGFYAGQELILLAGDWQTQNLGALLNFGVGGLLGSIAFVGASFLDDRYYSAARNQSFGRSVVSPPSR